MADKKPRQRVVITLTECDNGNFNMDLVFEPSIKGREEEVANKSCVVAARDVCAHVLSRWQPPKILAPDERPARQAVEKPRIIVPG